MVVLIEVSVHPHLAGEQGKLNHWSWICACRRTHMDTSFWNCKHNVFVRRLDVPHLVGQPLCIHDRHRRWGGGPSHCQSHMSIVLQALMAHAVVSEACSLTPLLPDPHRLSRSRAGAVRGTLACHKTWSQNDLQLCRLEQRAEPLQHIYIYVGGVRCEEKCTHAYGCSMYLQLRLDLKTLHVGHVYSNIFLSIHTHTCQPYIPMSPGISSLDRNEDLEPQLLSQVLKTISRLGRWTPQDTLKLNPKP